MLQQNAKINGEVRESNPGPLAVNDRNQLDFRFPTLRGFANTSDGGDHYQSILKDERVIHWFAENHDMTHPKISTLPTGIVPASIDDIIKFLARQNNSKSHMEISKRPLQFVLSDRIRDGTQWEARSTASKQCDNMIARNISTCVRPPNHHKYEADTGMPHTEFLSFITKYAFVACVHGGGIDPSPKALLVGTIPIIQHSTLDDAYERLPVMFVSEWSEIFDNPNVE
eukprot:gene32117-39667_t